MKQVLTRGRLNGDTKEGCHLIWCETTRVTTRQKSWVCMKTYIWGIHYVCRWVWCEIPSIWKWLIRNSTTHIFIIPGLQYIPRNMHTVFALLCFVVVIHWLIFPYPSGLLHWHCGNLTIAPVPAKQSWWIWINTSCEFIINDCITTTKQSTTKPCAYFLGYTVRDACQVMVYFTQCCFVGVSQVVIDYVYLTTQTHLYRMAIAPFLQISVPVKRIISFMIYYYKVKFHHLG